VILVNLTCGRNPWKQASCEDSTYRAFSKNPDFLKTILPLSDELNSILGMIFESNPEKRISVSELKVRIRACQTFTTTQTQLPISPPQSPIFSGNVSQGSALSFEEDGSVISDASDEGSLTGSCSTLSDLDSDSLSEVGDSGYATDPEEEQQAAVVQPPVQQFIFPTQQYVLDPQAQQYSGNRLAIPSKYAAPQQHWNDQFEQQYHGYPNQARGCHEYYPQALYYHHIRECW
jgi:serine/threonine protein kinase